jgi:2-phospho-L-lactate guanylyltransferase
LTVDLLAAVPVKDLDSVKQRLVGFLTAEERSDLVLVMLEDVLAAFSRSPVDALYVVTRDPVVMAIARRRGARVLAEDANQGHTQAVAGAQALAVAEGARRFLTVPGDVPCVTSEELEAVAAALPAATGAVFVPSVSGLGTNAALVAPADAMPLKFGEPSFENHLTAARARGLAPAVLRLPGLGLDVDAPEDLGLLLERGPATRTATFLRDRGVPARLAAPDRAPDSRADGWPRGGPPAPRGERRSEDLRAEGRPWAGPRAPRGERRSEGD